MFAGSVASGGDGGRHRASDSNEKKPYLRERFVRVEPLFQQLCDLGKLLT